MSEQVLLLLLGFLLTTVVGGLLGFYFQTRTWDSNRRESELQAAAAVFDDLSRILDRRLYRMRQLNWRLSSADKAQIEDAMASYRQSVLEWNENLNRNLALTYGYFGVRTWDYLDKTIFEDFVSLGRDIEKRYESWHKGDVNDSAARIEGRLDAVSDKLYNLNRFMIALVQAGEVGLYQSRAETWPEEAPWQTDQ